jgi:DNA ligase D-like protein (predicted 3'-phosphoesterase)
MTDRLDAYNRKRNFDVTAEPRGEPAPPSEQPLFVVQKHAASRLHYDFRLEVDGALASWAVPKGPSASPADKRFAVPTEDHPLGYARFEGTIASGEYGAGRVIIWDRGPYRNIMAQKDEPLTMRQALDEGHVEVYLEGEKLRGGYALIRTAGGKEEKWLLIKMDDEHARPGSDITAERPESVESGRKVEEL